MVKGQVKKKIFIIYQKHIDDLRCLIWAICFLCIFGVSVNIIRFQSLGQVFRSFCTSDFRYLCIFLIDWCCTTCLMTVLLFEACIIFFDYVCVLLDRWMIWHFMWYCSTVSNRYQTRSKYPMWFVYCNIFHRKLWLKITGPNLPKCDP